MHRQLRRQGHLAKRQSIERIQRENGLAVTASRRRRKIRTGTGVPVKAEYRNHVWIYDIAYDAMSSGRVLRALTVVDEFARLALAVH